MSLLRGTIKEKAGFNIDDLNPLKNHVGKSHSPAFFLSADDDELIDPSHAKRLHDAYKGSKTYLQVKGTHNSFREPYVNDAITIFFYNCFGLGIIEKKKKALVPDNNSENANPPAEIDSSQMSEQE